MPKQVLIVTNSADIHADAILPRFHAQGQQPFRINLDAFPRDYQICQRVVDGQLKQQVRTLPDGEWLDLGQVGAVWMRKPGEYAFLSADLSAQERAYAALETEQALLSMLYALDCYWISHPAALRASQWKGEQLQRAARMGFRVPASIVTNSAAEARRFQDSLRGRPMIFKAMSTPTLAAEKLEPDERIAGALRTALVTDEMLEQLDAVDELPCHFQEYIDKRYELRVTVIGERVFAAKIHSQDDPRTMIDSRDMSAEIRYEACALPRDVEQRCVGFVRSYGLEFGALDLIVTPDGEYVFLENNPCGQFLYVQQLVPELQMLEAVADKLIAEALCRS